MLDEKMKGYSKFFYDLLVVVFRSLWNSDLPMEKIVGRAFREAVSPNNPADCRMTFRFVGDLEKIVDKDNAKEPTRESDGEVRCSKGGFL